MSDKYEKLEMAMDAVRSKKFSVSGASRTYKVPETTLYENLRKHNVDIPFVSQSLVIYCTCVYSFVLF